MAKRLFANMEAKGLPTTIPADADISLAPSFEMFRLYCDLSSFRQVEGIRDQLKANNLKMAEQGHPQLVVGMDVFNQIVEECARLLVLSAWACELLR